MNIGIVTVYNIENCGSCLQAFALSNIIENMGHEVSFIKLSKRGTTHTISHHVIESMKRIVKLRFSEVPIEWKRYKAFCKIQKSFTETAENSSAMDKIDCIILGSDTIWNIDTKRFNNEMDLFFGLRFPEKKVISYAVSIANTPKEKFINNKKAIQGAKKLADISVRDNATYDMVKNVFNINPTMVCDPTLLLRKDDYNFLIKDKKAFSDSPILIYYFGNLPTETIEKIKVLKKKIGKKIISFGQYRKWCDINLPYDPYLFIQCYRDCSFVITNTYHGTIFSLIYEKNFADYGQGKKKIEHLLGSMGAENAFADNNDDLTLFYTDRLNYNVINKKITEQQNISMEFLKRNLNN